MSSYLTKYRVRDVIHGHMSGPSPTCEERQIADTYEWGLLKTTAVVWEGWNPTAHKVPPRQYWNNPRLEVQPGDVLVTKAGPRERVGVVVYVDETPPRLMVSGKMIGLRTNTQLVDSRVLAAALSTDRVQRYLDSRTTGMADSQLNFTNELLLDAEIELTSRELQTKIGQIISLVDKNLRSTKSLIAKYQQIKAGLMHDLFTRGVTADRKLRPPREQAPELYQETPIGWIPKEWGVMDLGSVTPAHAPICYGIVQPGSYVEDGIPVVAIFNLNASYDEIHKCSNQIERDYGRSRITSGDVLLSIKGTVGRVDVVPSGLSGNISRDVARIRPTEQFDSRFLRYQLESPAMQRQLSRIVVGTTRMELSIGRLKKVPLCKPKITEQSLIADQLSQMDVSLKSESNFMNQLLMQKAGLMHDLLTGRVRLRVA